MFPSFSQTGDNEALESGAPLALPRPGDVIDEKYEIIKLIGEGGMGVVFEARHVRLGHAVALKFLHPAAVLVPGATARFEREARASAQLRGPNVAHVLDVDATGEGAAYMVMELLRGRDLDAELHQRGPLPIAEAVDIVLQVCSAMKEAHGLGIVHRDLKPSNIFLARQEGGTGEALPVVKVLDFGISLIASPDAARVTSTSVSLGTPLYMSPEQVRCSKHVDSRTDIWAIGVILYETLVGAPPFSGEATAAVAAIVADETPSVRQKRHEVPNGLDSVIARALSKDLRRRFQTVDELADALATYGSGRIRAPMPVSARAHALARTWLSFPPTAKTLAFASGRRGVGGRISAGRARIMLALTACLFALPAITFAGLSRGPASARALPAEGAACSEVAPVPAAPVTNAARVEARTDRDRDPNAARAREERRRANEAPVAAEAAAFRDREPTGHGRARGATAAGDVPANVAPVAPITTSTPKVDPLYL